MAKKVIFTVSVKRAANGGYLAIAKTSDGTYMDVLPNKEALGRWLNARAKAPVPRGHGGRARYGG